MARLSLRRYDVQARVSAMLATASLVSLCGLAFFALRRLNWADKIIVYHPKSIWGMPAVYGLFLVTAGLSALAFGLGLNSAGQRRNDKPAQSWIGFFLGALTFSLAVVLTVMYTRWKESVTLMG